MHPRTLLPFLLLSACASATAGAPPAETRTRGLGHAVLAGAVNAPSTSTAPSPVHAVVVGVSDFKNLAGADDLASGEKSADAIATRLSQTFGADAVTVLKGKAATAAAVSGAVRDVLDKARAGETVILYFATHAARPPTGKEGYLLTWDSDPEGRVAATSFPLKALRDAISSTAAAHVLVFADAVHQTLVGTTAVRAGADSGVGALLLAARGDRESVLIMSNDGADELNPSCQGTSVFTCAIATALDGKADLDNDHQVALRELMAAVQGAVGKSDSQGRPSAAAANNLDTNLAFPVAAPQETRKPQVTLASMGSPPLDKIQVCFWTRRYADEGARDVPVPYNHVYHTGDVLRMDVTLPHEGYLFMSGSSADGSQAVLYPWRGLSNKVAAGGTVSVMPADDSEPILFNDPVGKERVYLVWSPDQMGSDAQILAATRAAASGTDSALAVADAVGGGTTRTRSLGHATAQQDNVGTRACSQFTPSGTPDGWTIDLTLEHQ